MKKILFISALFIFFCNFMCAQKANDNRFQRTITSIAVDSLEAQRIEQEIELEMTELDEGEIVESEPAIFVVTEQMPQFVGGDAALYKYLADSLRYPKEHAEICYHGRVVVRMVIDKEGNVVNPEIVRSLAPAYDEEVLRVVRGMPRWIPGRQCGIPVPVYFMLPISFTPIREEVGE